MGGGGFKNNEVLNIEKILFFHEIAEKNTNY